MIGHDPGHGERITSKVAQDMWSSYSPSFSFLVSIYYQARGSGFLGP